MPINVSMREDANSGTCRKEQGFTLVEVIVVLSVVLLLTGIAVPMLSTYMEDGRRARAESECKTIGAAVLGFYKDVGVYPARNSSPSNNPRPRASRSISYRRHRLSSPRFNCRPRSDALEGRFSHRRTSSASRPAAQARLPPPNVLV